MRQTCAKILAVLSLISIVMMPRTSDAHVRVLPEHECSWCKKNPKRPNPTATVIAAKVEEVVVRMIQGDSSIPGAPSFGELDSGAEIYLLADMHIEVPRGRHDLRTIRSKDEAAKVARASGKKVLVVQLKFNGMIRVRDRLGVEIHYSWEYVLPPSEAHVVQTSGGAYIWWGIERGEDLDVFEGATKGIG